MTHAYYDVAFTPPVQALQERHGSRSSYARAALHPRGNDRLGGPEAAFIAERDGFYLGSTSETGWPYVQFRGGPPGFVRMLSPEQLGWSDFRGNQQFITAGNILGEDRVSLFFMDYGGRRRLKVYGRLAYVDPEANADLAEALAIPGSKARVDRLAIVEVAAWDRNCPQRIPQRYTLAELGLPDDFAVPEIPAASSR